MSDGRAVRASSSRSKWIYDPTTRGEESSDAKQMRELKIESKDWRDTKYRQLKTSTDKKPQKKKSSDSSSGTSASGRVSTLAPHPLIVFKWLTML
jgi:hypothetical protein